jgi:hypothetical protein
MRIALHKTPDPPRDVDNGENTGTVEGGGNVVLPNFEPSLRLFWKITGPRAKRLASDPFSTTTHSPT